MAEGATLRVEGYRELVRAFAGCDKATKRELRATLRHAGEAVQAGAIQRLSPVDARSAAGYKVRVRQRGVAVEQSLRKTTGQHPEWGSYQMRHALLPALISNEDELNRELERALDQISREFERRG
jgi:hypothetical protein